MKCTLCPRRCGVDRNIRIGACSESEAMRICRAAKHYYEEPCISGTDGSGAIFFSGCSLGCVYCQNYGISRSKVTGKTVTSDELADIMLDLQAQNSHNINLVTATHFTPWVAEAIKIAKKRGLTVPVVWNSSGYELKDTLSMLCGLADVYLPDCKYANAEQAKRLSSAADYPAVALDAIEEMLRQVGEPTFKDGLIKRGVIVRHLVLPGMVLQSKMTLKALFNRFGNRICYSVMRQYTPVAPDLPLELSRRITDAEYKSVVDYVGALGIEHAYGQESGCAEESFIPEFR